jgi:NADPH2:quinone reductase
MGAPPQIAKAGEVLVRVRASSVNPLDTKIRARQAAHAKQPLPAVLGLDMAGVVEEVGDGVTAFKRGDEVYGRTGGWEACRTHSSRSARSIWSFATS